MRNRRPGKVHVPQDVEEQLRGEVIRHVRGVVGGNAALAKYLGVAPGFISEYMSGARRSAGLHRALQMMRYVGISVNEYLTQIEAPPEAALIPALRDHEVELMVEAMIRLRADPKARTSLVRTAQAMAAEFGAPMPKPTQTPASASAPAARTASNARRR